MIRVFLDGKELGMEFMTFTGGERHVKIKGYKKWNIRDNHEQGGKYLGVMDVEVYAYVDSSDVIMDMLLVKDALDRMDKGSLRSAQKTLHIPYIPFARQDRVMVDGEALSSVVMANLINSMNFDVVMVDDPHSDVISSHIKNVVICDQADRAIEILGRGFFEGLVLVAPDAGAMKKTLKLAEKVGVTEVGFGMKRRDVTTGVISGTSYTGPDLSGKAVLMVDDIAEGGFTFTSLAKVLREEGAEEIYLYVTHGIFSKGIDEPFDGVIDRIYSAYPWKKNIVGRNEKGIFISVDGSVDFE